MSVFSLWKRLLILFFLALCLSCSACATTVDYYDYVSECRSNIFLAETDGFSLRAYAVIRESPYHSDGVVMERRPRFELYLLAPSGDKTCNLSFQVDGKEYGGEMSYDNVKAEYYYFCSLDVANAREIACVVSYGEERISLVANSVLQADILTPKVALQKLCEVEKTLFSDMTDDYGFAGEIYLRLLYEDAPFYYVGVIDKDGKSTAFLLDGKTGNVLAKRQN